MDTACPGYTFSKVDSHDSVRPLTDKASSGLDAPPDFNSSQSEFMP